MLTNSFDAAAVHSFRVLLKASRVTWESFNSTARVVGYRPITAQQNLLRTPLVRAKLTRVASIRKTKWGLPGWSHLPERAASRGSRRGGELGEGFGVRGGEGVGDGKIAPGEVLGAHVGDVGIDHRLHLGVRWYSGGRRGVGDCHLLPLALLGLHWRHNKAKSLEGKGNA